MSPTITKTGIRLATILTVLTVSSALVAQAEQIASDSFAVSAGGDDYVSFSSILGQDPTVGASGFVGAWEQCCTGSMVPVPGGLTHPLSPGETFDGQLFSFTSNGSVGGGNARNLSRAIDYTPVDGTYFMSVLLNKNADTTTRDLLIGLGSLQGAETSIFGVDGTYIGFVDGAITFFSGPGPDLTTLVSAGQTTVDETYFALMQYDFSTSGADTVTATIFDGSSSEVASQAFPGLSLDGTLGRIKVAMQEFGPSTSVDEWRFGTEQSDVMVVEPNVDFNGDGISDVTDLDLMQSLGPIATGVPATGNEQFDLNGDDVIDLFDRDEWLAIAATENGLGSPYKLGDANVSGFVDGQDFIAWNVSKFTPSLLWSAGDFNADGTVDGADFIAWNANKFTSSDVASAVPEPGTTSLMAMGLMFLLAAARVRS